MTLYVQSKVYVADEEHMYHIVNPNPSRDENKILRCMPKSILSTREVVASPAGFPLQVT